MTDGDSTAGGTSLTGWRRSLRSIEAAAVAGIVAAIGWVYALLRLLQGPGVDASEAEITRFYANPDTGWDTLFVLQILVIATAGFLWFIGVIRNRVGQATATLFDTVFFGGGILYAALVFVGAAALAAPFMLADIGGMEVEAGSAALLRNFARVVLGVFASRVAALVVISTSTLGLRTGALPRWLVLVGYVTGVGILLNVTFFTPSVYAFPGWIAVVSLVLLIRRTPSHLQPA
jgi:hypothetical protein